MSITVEPMPREFRLLMWLNSCLQSAISTVEQWRCASRRSLWRTLCRERAFGCAFPLVSYRRRCQLNVTELASDAVYNHQNNLLLIQTTTPQSDYTRHLLPQNISVFFFIISSNDKLVKWCIMNRHKWVQHFILVYSAYLSHKTVLYSKAGSTAEGIRLRLPFRSCRFSALHKTTLLELYVPILRS